jgi:hypothetical protein
VIETAEADPLLTIKRDDLPLDKESWAKAIAVDPGSYVIVAEAPGKKPWTKTVEIEAWSKVVTVEVPELELVKMVPELELAKAGTVPPAVTPAPEKVPSTDGPPSDRQRWTPNLKLLTLGGVTALGAGTFFAFRYKNANDEAKAICPSSVGCTSAEITQHTSKVDKAATARTWTYIGFGTGALALGGAAVLYLLNGSEQPTHASIRALPAVGERGELGASVVGAF